MGRAAAADDLDALAGAERHIGRLGDDAAGEPNGVIEEAALSYLGLGTQPPQPSWGRMLNEAQSQLFQSPLLAVYPGVAIMLSVLGLNLLGDGLRDLWDPKLARAR